MKFPLRTIQKKKKIPLRDLNPNSCLHFTNIYIYKVTNMLKVRD